MADKPVMRQFYDRLAAQLGPQVTELTAGDRFAEAAEVAGAVRTRAATEMQRSSRRLLHAWNLPAGSDIAVLRQEIGALERAVRTLSRQVESLQRQLDVVADTPPTVTKTTTAKKTAAKKTAAKQASTKQASTKQASTKQASTKQASTKKTPTKTKRASAASGDSDAETQRRGA